MKSWKPESNLQSKRSRKLSLSTVQSVLSVHSTQVPIESSLQYGFAGSSQGAMRSLDRMPVICAASGDTLDCYIVAIS